MRLIVLIVLLVNILVACSEQDRILPGKRVDAATAFGFSDQNKKSFTKVKEIKLPSMKINDEWRVVASAVSKNNPNLMLAENLSEAWSVSIGKGDSKKKRLVTDPIFFEDKIFTLDANSIASAFDVNGELIWKKDLTPPGEKRGEIFGGGLTIGQDQLFITLTYGFLISLDPLTGERNWSQRLSGAGNTIPVFNDGLVYLVSGDSKAWAISADKGRVRWQIDALGSDTNRISSNSPTVDEKYAIFGFGNGEIYTTFKKGGYVLWSSSLSRRNDGRVISSINDIVASPVIIGQNVFVADGSGKVVSLKVVSGEEIGQLRLDPIVISGWQKFFIYISNTNHLTRLEINTGDVVWMKELRSFSKNRLGGSKKFIQYYGPIIAGNQIVLASSDGFIRFYNPETGEQKSELKIKNGATTNPIVATKPLYLIPQDGNLRAFR